MLPARRICYQGDLYAVTPISTLSGQGRIDCDMVVVRDRDGFPVLNGPTVTGTLRRLATRAAALGGYAVCDPMTQVGGCGQCVVCELFGSSKSGASLVAVEAACLRTEYRNVPTEVREHVCIDRRFRSAANAEASKFNREIVPAGVVFRLSFQYYRPDDDEIYSRQNGVLSQALLLMMRQDGVPFGGGRTAGRGFLRLQALQCVTVDLKDLATLVEMLQDKPMAFSEISEKGLRAAVNAAKAPGGDDDALDSKSLPLFEIARRARITFRGRLRPLAPFLVKSVIPVVELSNPNPILPRRPPGALAEVEAEERGDFDSDVYCTTLAGPLAGEIRNAPCLPGTALKGPIRAHGERILRTRLANAQPDRVNTHCTACIPHERDAGPLQSCARRLGRKAEARRAVAGGELCPACTFFGSTFMGGLLTLFDALPVNCQNFQKRFKELDFVALDRWTEGVKHSAKFDARVFFPQQRENDEAGDLNFTMQLEVDDKRKRRWHLALVGLILRDLAIGRLHFGYGRSKGFGRMRLDLCTVELEAPHEHWLWERIPSQVELNSDGWLRRASLGKGTSTSCLWFWNSDAVGSLFSLPFDDGTWSSVATEGAVEVCHG